jgi:PhnB protein
MVSPVPENFHPVTPALVATPCADAIDFYIKAFGAEEIVPRMTGPDGLVGHAEISIEGCVVILGDEWPDGPTQSPTTLGGSTSALFIYTENAEELWERAVSAGAEVVYPLEMQFYGHLGGRLRDPFGHSWGIGKQVEEVSEEEMNQRVAGFYEEQAGD